MPSDTARASIDLALSLDHGRLRDTLGREVLLRGANVGGRSKMPPFAPFDFDEERAPGEPGSFAERLDVVMGRIAALGCNCVRLPFTWESVEPTRGDFRSDRRARLGLIIDAAAGWGIRTILDFHQDIYARIFGGDGFPAWTLSDELRAEGLPAPRCELGASEWFLRYVEEGGPVARAFDELWANERKIRADLSHMWRWMMDGLGERAGVIGYEVINEPGWGTREVAAFEREVLPGVIEEVAHVVDEVAPRALVFGGGPGIDAVAGETHMLRPDHPRFVYAPHVYDPSVLAEGPYFGAQRTSEVIERFCEVARRWDCPALFGEFGAPAVSPGGELFLHDAYAAFDEHRAHATVWEISASKQQWNHEDLSLLDDEANERPFADAIVRPYPRAVAGQLKVTAWDAERGHYTLEVEEAPDDVKLGSHISEVFAPVRRLGAEPEVRLSDGTYRREGDSILVDAPYGFVLEVQRAGDVKET